MATVTVCDICESTIGRTKRVHKISISLPYKAQNGPTKTVKTIDCCDSCLFGIIEVRPDLFSELDMDTVLTICRPELLRKGASDEMENSRR